MNPLLKQVSLSLGVKRLYLLILFGLTNMVTKNISITKEMAQWIKNNDLSLSKLVQRHLRELMKNER